MRCSGIGRRTAMGLLWLGALWALAQAGASADTPGKKPVRAADGRPSGALPDHHCGEFLVRLKPDATEGDRAAVAAAAGGLRHDFRKTQRKRPKAVGGLFNSLIRVGKRKPGAKIDVDARPHRKDRIQAGAKAKPPKLPAAKRKVCRCAAKAAELARHPAVVYATPVIRPQILDVFPNDPFFPYEDHLHNTGALPESTPDSDLDMPEAWSITTGTGGAVLGINDWCLDVTHPDIAPNLWVNPGETGLDAQGRDRRTNGVDDDGNGYADDVHGWNFSTQSPGTQPDPAQELSYHGTAVAAVAAARGNDGFGMTGVAWNAKLMALSFFPNGDFIEAIQYGVQNGVDVINMSWGWDGGYFYPPLQDAILEARESGAIFVAAAGNSGSTDLNNPAAMEGVLSVAAVDHRDILADFSTRNSRVDLSAPGRWVFAPWPLPIEAPPNPSTIVAPTGHTYTWVDGTSFASPCVAGAAALLVDHLKPRIADPVLRRDKVESLLLLNTDDIRALNPGYEGLMGTGRLNVWSAFQADQDATPPTPPQQVAVEASGSSWVRFALQGAVDNVAVRGYRVETSVDGVTFVDTGKVYPVSPVRVEGLASEVERHFRFRALDGAGNLSAPSFAVLASTGPVQPPAFTVPVRGNAFLHVSISSPAIGTDIAGFRAETSVDGVSFAQRMTAPDPYGLHLASITAGAAEFDVFGLHPLTAYTLRVRAVDAAGNLSTPVDVHASTGANSAPPAPSRLVVNSGYPWPVGRPYPFGVVYDWGNDCYDSLTVVVDMGDGTTVEFPPDGALWYGANEVYPVPHRSGTLQMRTKIRDQFGAESGWSAPITAEFRVLPPIAWTMHPSIPQPIPVDVALKSTSEAAYLRVPIYAWGNLPCRVVADLGDGRQEELAFVGLDHFDLNTLGQHLLFGKAVSWPTMGTYTVRVKTIDRLGQESDWVHSHTVRFQSNLPRVTPRALPALSFGNGAVQARVGSPLHFEARGNDGYVDAVGQFVMMPYYGLEIDWGEGRTEIVDFNTRDEIASPTRIYETWAGGDTSYHGSIVFRQPGTHRIRARSVWSGGMSGDWLGYYTQADATGYAAGAWGPELLVDVQPNPGPSVPTVPRILEALPLLNGFVPTNGYGYMIKDGEVFEGVCVAGGAETWPSGVLNYVFQFYARGVKVDGVAPGASVSTAYRFAPPEAWPGGYSCTFYPYRVQAVSEAGPGPWTSWQWVVVGDPFFGYRVPTDLPGRVLNIPQEWWPSAPAPASKAAKEKR